MPRRNTRKKNELGTSSAGQSGDIQQLPEVAEAESEIVEETRTRTSSEPVTFPVEALDGRSDANRATGLTQCGTTVAWRTNGR